MRKRSGKTVKGKVRRRDANRSAFSAIQHIVDQLEGGSPLTPDGKDSLAVAVDGRRGLSGDKAHQTLKKR